MPRIPDNFLDCVIYLYRTVQEAESGEKYGGGGFIAGVPSQRLGPGERFFYAVTNRHVVFEHSSPVIRINTHDGKTDILDIEQDAWTPHPGGDDLAMVGIGFDPRLHKFRGVPDSMFISEQIIKAEDIGPGDDTYMVGRFVNHEGKQRNQPSVRFGNIAMMPGEPLMNESGNFQDGFVVEMRSICGYSGSPIFVHVPPFALRPGRKGYSGGRGPWLLGIDWGHVFDKEPIRNQYGEPLSEGWHIRSNSGMIGVIPAWKLYEMLHDEKTKAIRFEYEGEELARRNSRRGGIEMDASVADKELPAKEENPRHKEDFNRLLNAAVQKRPQDDQT